MNTRASIPTTPVDHAEQRSSEDQAPHNFEELVQEKETEAVKSQVASLVESHARNENLIKQMQHKVALWQQKVISVSKYLGSFSQVPPFSCRSRVQNKDRRS